MLSVDPALMLLVLAHGLVFKQRILGYFCVNLGWKEGQGSSSFGTRGQKSCERWLDLLAPVFLALANVGLVAELSHLLGLGEELVGLLRECLLY